MSVSGQVVPRVVVIGAGIAGVACARALDAEGLSVTVLDRGHRIGGRMAVRTVDVAGRRHPVDIGASYLTAREDGFVAVVDDWLVRGVARPWTSRFHLSDGSGLDGTTNGPVRYAAAGGLRALVEDLAEGLDVRHPHRARAVGPLDGGGVDVDGDRADAVVLAMPDQQARALLPAGIADELFAGRDWGWDASVVVYAAWPRRWWPELDGVFVRSSGVLSWVADDGRRRGDGAPVLVAHTTPEKAAQHLDAPDAAVPDVLASLGRVMGRDVPEPLWARAMRWRLSKPRREHPAPDYALHPSGIGVCGDDWGARSRVEGAWASGTKLGRRLARQLSASGHLDA